jgi:excisionase family DNA binding protein
MIEPLIDVAAAAKIIGVSKRQLARMAAAGEIPAMRVGKYWKFRASALDAWIREQLECSYSTCPSQRSSVQ